MRRLLITDDYIIEQLLMIDIKRMNARKYLTCYKWRFAWVKEILFLEKISE
ncbi:MAG: hypothetical protein E6300_18305 [Clostridium sp.]|uniref:hypothetical protein n=1 Tax=Clostridium sp. TaxID=1506 RepID=UPI0029076F1A|nr:hypothetical protein [Clostridium sp.]MDU7150417.1 hypothetical protein [Clostridium sp.]